MTENSKAKPYLLEWRRAQGQVVRLVIQKFGGKDLLHLRAHYLDGGGQFKPMKEGVTIPHDQILPLRKALRQAEATLAADNASEGEIEEKKPRVKKGSRNKWGKKKAG